MASLLRLMLLLLLLHISTAISVASSRISPSESLIELPLPNKLGGESEVDSEIEYCNSWKYVVDTNILRVRLRSPPERCVDFVKDYMTGPQYQRDLDTVLNYATAYATGINVTGTDAWIFDVDDTLLSTVEYHYGSSSATGFSHRKFQERRVDAADDVFLPAIPQTLTLFNTVKKLGFKIFLLTSRRETERTSMEDNLTKVGFNAWDRLIMKSPTCDNPTTAVYKSQKRMEIENEGFTIQGSIGDQWSDLQGYALAKRSFKVPNLMYYHP